MNFETYNNYNKYFKKQFHERIQKISIDAGFTCPNRDGFKAFGGCTYCYNKSFNPFYCSPEKTVTQQLNEGISFFSKKYKTQQYLAYFQAYTNTYSDLETLKKLYDEALNHKKVIGLVIATRPDAVNEEKLNYIKSLQKKYFVVIEYGVESVYNKTLEFINRGHTHEETVEALKLTKQFDIPVGVHIILGLPPESREEILRQADILSKLPFQILKLHQLQILKGTTMAKQFAENPEAFKTYSAEEYIDLVIDFLEHLKPEIMIERFISESPKDMIISPNWKGLKNFEFVAKLEKQMRQRKTFQGKLYRN